MRSERLPNWEERLAATIESARRRRFAWGVHDCGLFVADVCLALTGRDPIADLRGRYRTPASAWRALVREGGPLAFGRRFGEPIPPAMARRGDAVLIGAGARWPAFGVCVGAFCAGPDSDGLLAAPMRFAFAAWAVGGR